MFPSMWTKQVVAAACLLCGSWVGQTAFAGPIVMTSEIEGQYDTNLGDLTPPTGTPFDFSFQLFSGELTSPTDLSKNTTLPNSTGLTPASLKVDESQASTSGPNPPPVVVTLTNQDTLSSDFTLTGTILGDTGTIDYTINSPQIESPNVITSEVTLNVPNTTLTTVDLTNLNPALLTITFASNNGGVSLDPSWPSGYSGPVYFSITPLPEPASIVYMAWVGAIGAMGYWRRHRRAALADQKS